MISETGLTSNFAATRGTNDFPTAEAPVRTWVELVFFMVSRIRGVNFSGRKPLSKGSSTMRTLETPLVFATSEATEETLDPATKHTTSFPIFLAAVTVLKVEGDNVSLLWSTI